MSTEHESPSAPSAAGKDAALPPAIEALIRSIVEEEFKSVDPVGLAYTRRLELMRRAVRDAAAPGRAQHTA